MQTRDGSEEIGDSYLNGAKRNVGARSRALSIAKARLNDRTHEANGEIYGLFYRGSLPPRDPSPLRIKLEGAGEEGWGGWRGQKNIVALK